MTSISIYIHIPFCSHKCIYCDFYSIITDENTSEYNNALKTEIEFFAEKYSSHYVDTIFLGGGTPSLLNSEIIQDILSKIYSSFNVKTECEITLETNPGTVDLNKLKLFKSMGINRISIGVQTFNDDELKFLTRIHDKQTAISTIKNAAEAGFENINLDLIFNLPKQTKKIWEENLLLAVQLPVKHISAYSLILERGTILSKMVLDGKVELQDDDYDADLYEYTIKFLTENGFQQYEVSNFCKDGFECKHNLNYWKHKNYLGFGPSAHSFFQDERWWNLSSLKMYIESVKSNRNAIRDKEKLDTNQLREEFVMLALRSNGLDLDEYKKKFATDFFASNEQYLSQLIQLKYLVREKNILKFTRKGYPICDEVLINIK